jgi:type II secretory pathway pseudopilin PulG
MMMPGTIPLARCAERGYALLVIMFSVALLAASAMTVLPNILTNGRREREQEMIWRGKQYARAVRLYNTKLGHFPTSLDDLTKPKTGSIHFMRQAYKDPMNKEDGTWRLIYVGPAGQLVGSLKPPDPLTAGQAAGGLGTSAAAVAGASGQAPSLPGSSGFGSSGSSGFGSSSSGFGSSNSSFGSSSSGSFGSSSSSFGSSNSGFGSSSSGVGFSSADDLFANNGQPVDPNNDPYLNPQVSNIPDTSNVVGGNIIGVGSKINQHSIKVYEKAKNYLLFEFVWNPSKDAAAALQQLNAPGTQGLGTPVANPGGNPQSPFGQNGASGTPTGTAQGGQNGQGSQGDQNGQSGQPTSSQPQPQNPPQP